jgi:dihydroorotase
MNNLIIKNGQLIDPQNGVNQLADIQVINGKIAVISEANSLNAPDDSQVIDASNLIIMPGIVDCCSRLREPGMEYKATIQTETMAATKAGITTLFCPPDTDPVIYEPAVVELIHHMAASSAHSIVFTLGALTAGLRGERLSDMYALQQAG